MFSYRQMILPMVALSTAVLSACGGSDSSSSGSPAPSSGSGSSSSSVSASSSSSSSSMSSSSSTSSSSSSSSSSSAPVTASGFGIAIKGSKFISTQTGQTVQLLGASLSGLEQGATALNTSDGGYPNATDPDFALMASSDMNLVRIPLNEDTWLGINNCTTDGGSAATLQSNIKQIVANANANGIYVILDLHWGAPQAFGCPVGQPAMADADNAVNFWTSVANTFKNNPAVMFEMFNEPFANYNYNNSIAPIDGTPPAGQSATDLSILKNGGTYDNSFYYQCNGGGLPCPSGQSQGAFYQVTSYNFNVAGMQQMLNAIRATGAKNVVLSNAMWFAGEIETWLSSMPTDPAGQLAAGWHEDSNGKTTDAQQILAAGYPVIITEAYSNGNDAVSNSSDTAGANYFNWAVSNQAGFSYWNFTNWGGTGTLMNSGSSYVLSALGTSLKASYCAAAVVNPAATCSN